jgi:hypothetical protein
VVFSKRTVIILCTVKLRRTFAQMAKRFHKFRFNERSLQMEEFPFALRDYLLFGFKKILFFPALQEEVSFFLIFISKARPTVLVKES